ncbi:hypothetical protein [Oceanotoga phage vB_OteS-UFV02]
MLALAGCFIGGFLIGFSACAILSVTKEEDAFLRGQQTPINKDKKQL